MATLACAAALTACSGNDTQAMQQGQLTVADLQPLPAGEYAPPYNKTATVGKSCKLVAYSFTLDDGQQFYEYVLYDRAPQPIDKNRAARAADIEALLNQPPSICA